MPTTRKPYHHGDLAAALLHAGGELLAAEGPEALSLRELARRTGVSHQAPYRHFADKDALLAALAAEGFVELGRAVAKAAARYPDDAVEQLVVAGVAYVEQGLRRPELYRLMFGRLSSQLTPQSQRLEDESHAAFGHLVAVIERGQACGAFKPGDPQELAAAAWCLVHGLASLLIDERLDVLPEGAKARRQFLDQMCRHLPDGLRAGQRSAAASRRRAT